MMNKKKIKMRMMKMEHFSAKFDFVFEFFWEEEEEEWLDKSFSFCLSHFPKLSEKRIGYSLPQISLNETIAI